MDQPPQKDAPPDPLPTGRLDIHSHLLPAVDDGCADVQESIDCVRRLQAAGFVGSICTPHVYPDDPTCIQLEDIRQHVATLARRLTEQGLDYRLWPGGELRVYNGIIDWLKHHEVPTLAGSRCVLMDFWAYKWPKWAKKVFEWLVENRYQPILAHPERLHCTRALDKQLAQLAQKGVWLQGNFRCMTGEDGYEPDLWVRRLISENRYRFMALDMHGLDSLEGRLDGMHLVEAEFGRATLDRFTVEAPRQLILSAAAN